MSAAVVRGPIVGRVGRPATRACSPAAITVQGEVLDLACYMGHEAKGEDHAKCAQSCVKSGQPMGLLTSDGTVYLLYASHRDAAPFEETKSHAGKQVELQGKPADRSGMKGIEVSGVKAL